ncbi:MAG: MCE family protein [Bdellovibrionales bacterium]|nr:MCE family protein [Oligoflexia bacterium]
MSNANAASTKTKLKTGLFTLAGIAFMGTLTVYVNNKPFWWRACAPVQITVEDATGLKIKSPVRSLGLEIGYISDIGLVSSGVNIRICVTAPVEVQPETKAYVRAEGFLGDRFLELKPVKYTGNHRLGDEKVDEIKATITPASTEEHSSRAKRLLIDLFGIPSAQATDAMAADKNPAKTVPVGAQAADMQQVMSEMKSLTTSLKESINPEEIRGTIRQLNKTLEDASRALSPQGGLTQTAQRSLIKLEDAIEQLRDQITRVNQGQGSVGMVLNDPVYAEELRKALLNMNHLLNKASEMRLTVQLGLMQLTAYQAVRAAFEVTIWPRPDRFYRIGLGSDPRGSISQTTSTTEYNGVMNGPITNTQVNYGAFVFTALVGKHLNRRTDIAVGILYGDGDASLNINLGPIEDMERLQLKGDLYFRARTSGGRWTALPDGRIYAIYQPYSILFLCAGIEGFRKVGNSASLLVGGGIRFEDEDIRLLLSFL